jgi:hypothetical protein
MCAHCELNKHGFGKPMAKNKIGGISTPLVDLWLDNESRNNKMVLVVHYDEEEPLTIEINYCPMCGRKLTND